MRQRRERENVNYGRTSASQRSRVPSDRETDVDVDERCEFRDCYFYNVNSESLEYSTVLLVLVVQDSTVLLYCP